MNTRAVLSSGYAIHTKNIQEAEKLFSILRKFNLIWGSGDELKGGTRWEEYGAYMCYRVLENKYVVYANTDYYEINKIDIISVDGFLKKINGNFI